MRNFNDSTLWRISEYERMRAEAGQAGFARPSPNTVLPTTLVAELSQLERRRGDGDLLEVVAACMRQHESALILVRHRGLVWPLTLFPRNNLYHLPRSLIDSLPEGSRELEVISVEPPGLRPPGHLMHERIADRPGYRHLPPLLWALALYAPRATLLDDIAGRAAYRVTADFVDEGILRAGALGPALKRLRSEITSLSEIARWPGMDRERAARVLNGIYLQGGLIVLRSHAAARRDVDIEHRLRHWLRWPR
jgi:hypothetical protein